MRKKATKSYTRKNKRKKKIKPMTANTLMLELCKMSLE